jgi:hypothetical protein
MVEGKLDSPRSIGTQELELLGHIGEMLKMLELCHVLSGCGQPTTGSPMYIPSPTTACSHHRTAENLDELVDVHFGFTAMGKC